MNKPVLACYQLARSYNDGVSKIEVLKNMELEVQPSEMIAIVGTSGSGKSTFLQLLGGLDKPTSGRVEINGKVLKLPIKQLCFCNRMVRFCLYAARIRARPAVWGKQLSMSYLGVRLPSGPPGMKRIADDFKSSRGFTTLLLEFSYLFVRIHTDSCCALPRE